VAAPPLTLRRLAEKLQRLDDPSHGDHRLRWVLSWVDALEATDLSARPALWTEDLLSERDLASV